MSPILISLIVLGVIGIIAGVLLYAAARKFHVYEDPRIAEVEHLLPGANCGGCGFSGCHAFAVAAAGTDSLDGFNCTSLDDAGMSRVADTLGLTASAGQKRKAVVKCSLSCDNRNPNNVYDGIRSCAVEAAMYQGESDCIYGCLGCGDCVRACPFDAMTIKPGDALPSVDLRRCVGCGKCVDACPRHIVELADYDLTRQLVWVACSNRDKGPVAMKECGVACIGCGICKKKCTHDAITIDSFLAHIDSSKCVGCGECIDPCPRHSITSNQRKMCAGVKEPNQ